MTTNTNAHDMIAQMTANNPAMAEVAARAREMAATTPKGRKGKTPQECACGCGKMTKGGTWMPGHDAKALSALLALARAEAKTPKTDTAAA